MARKKRQFYYEFESHNRHGLMRCQICGKCIEKGSSYRWWETSDAYLSEHRSCTEEDPMWATFDKQKQKSLDYKARYYAALLEFVKEWGEPDEDDIYLAKEWKRRN